MIFVQWTTLWSKLTVRQWRIRYVVRWKTERWHLGYDDSWKQDVNSEADEQTTGSIISQRSSSSNRCVAMVTNDALSLEDAASVRHSATQQVTCWRCHGGRGQSRDPLTNHRRAPPRRTGARHLRHHWRQLSIILRDATATKMYSETAKFNACLRNRAGFSLGPSWIKVGRN